MHNTLHNIMIRKIFLSHELINIHDLINSVIIVNVATIQYLLNFYHGAAIALSNLSVLSHGILNKRISYVLLYLVCGLGKILKRIRNFTKVVWLIFESWQYVLSTTRDHQ